MAPAAAGAPLHPSESPPGGDAPPADARAPIPRAPAPAPAPAPAAAAAAAAAARERALLPALLALCRAPHCARALLAAGLLPRLGSALEALLRDGET